MDARVLLLVEDEPLIAMTMQDVLEAAGFRVVLAPDGNSASRTLDQCLGDVGALITDIRLGAGPDGWSIAEKARNARPDLPVLYVTGHGAADWTQRGVPGSEVLQKPVSAQQMLAKLEVMLS